MSLQFKQLLPITTVAGNDKHILNMQINTKILPLKGNLVYEYNPLRNYRINDDRYLYKDKFYSLKELLELNIFTDIVNIYSIHDFKKIKDNDTYKLYILKYYENPNSTTILFTGIKFNIPISGSTNYMHLAIPLDTSLYFMENEFLDNGEYVKFKLTPSSNGNYLYLYSPDQDKGYITGYNSNTNKFTYSETPNQQIIGISEKVIIESPNKLSDLSIIYNKNSTKFYHKMGQYVSIIDNDIPLYFLANSLVDFLTDELTFNLEHPVQILPLYSYDGSVNLILTDGYSKPRLINTRFSATGKNTYLIVDRKGNNDTNIYDSGDQFDIDTSLYKLTNNIPKLKLLNVYSGGKLTVGNYHFYITYSDADGNETDFVAESGLISIFIGNSIKSVRLGWRNENSFKGVKLLLQNVDPAYSYLNIYYTKATGDINLNAEILAYKLNNQIFINNTESQIINITGYEDVTQIDLATINPTYLIVETAETLATNNNILFLGNLQKLTPNYTELTDLALRFGPVLDTSEEYVSCDENYNRYFNGLGNSYYDPEYIYNKVGYWPEEIYRFGIVFILGDNTLTPVFNTRGINNLHEYDSSDKSMSMPYTVKGLSVNNSAGERLYIEINDNTKLLTKGNASELENSKGVVRIHSLKTKQTNNLVYGLKFKILSENDLDRQDVINTLKKYCKGFFFVRQKRIPTVLCEAMSIGIDENSHHPCLPVDSNIITVLENLKKVDANESVKLSDSSNYTTVSSSQEVRCCPYSNYKGLYGYISECFLAMNRELTNTFDYHVRVSSPSKVSVEALICPDYDLNYPYYNNIFTGSEFSLLKSVWQPKYRYLQGNSGQRHFYPESYEYNATSNTNNVLKVRLLGVEDNTPMVGLGDSLYSGTAGDVNMGYKFDLLNSGALTTETTSLLRGVWGPFLAAKSDKKITTCTTYMIMIPGYDAYDMNNYFTIRYNDKSSYHAISERYTISEYDDDTTLYRGDCYICLFTHRMNRNFNDSSAPYNDTIVNSKTWKGENNGSPTSDEKEEDYKGFVVDNGTIKLKNFDHINIGDINAVRLGHWITFLLRSSINLNIRALDESDVAETVRTGHGKGFYPYLPLSARGSYKHAEGLCYNKGYEKSVSERYNYEAPDIPALKNNFTNRIAYSNIAITDSFENGFRIFKSTSFLDYQMNYGAITKLLSYKEGLLIIFEHGVSYIGVNERSLLANASSGNIYIDLNKVIPDDGNMTIISDCFGSLWKESIIKTPYAVYGVDTQAKKIWLYSDSGFICISDFKVLKFLNDNISLSERELTPILGLRNVKTHYNRFKNDVMFTFYDDLEDSLEKVWNLCYNENLKLFITFYSWVPSYSENIYNQYFSFDRQTSKWIAKLGQSVSGNDFSLSITLSIDEREDASVLPDFYINRVGINAVFGLLGLNNVNCKSITKFEILHDNLQNYKLFTIRGAEDGLKDYTLTLANDIPVSDLLAELYYRIDGKETTDRLGYYVGDGNEEKGYERLDDDLDNSIFKNAIYLSAYFDIKQTSEGRRKELPNPINKNKLVYILNIRCTYTTLNGATKTLDSSIAVTLQYNLQFLTTDFWKHGQAGLLDIADKILPTHWYGKQHPFEIEFIVAKNPEVLKIFDNLIILSNNAEPESFHYDVVGDGYGFAWDKPNMYYRQEATEAFYLYNGSDIEYDTDFTEVVDLLNHKKLYKIYKGDLTDDEYELYQGHEFFKDLDETEITPDSNSNIDTYVKSTLLPLYYSRTNSYNEIEDYYKLYTTLNKNYDALSGAEIIYDSTINEFRIWSHSKGVDIKGPGGRIRGNMEYLEDRWIVQINPLNYLLKNETEWLTKSTDNADGKPPIVLNNSPIPEDLIIGSTNSLQRTTAKNNEIDINTSDMFPKILINQGYENDRLDGIDINSWGTIKLTKLRDKFMRVRIRYSGKKLAIIQSVMTIFRTSYA